MANTTAPAEFPTIAQQLARALAENESLADRLARVETLRQRMTEHGSPVTVRWAEVLGDVLSI